MQYAERGLRVGEISLPHGVHAFSFARKLSGMRNHTDVLLYVPEGDLYHRDWKPRSSNS